MFAVSAIDSFSDMQEDRGLASQIGGSAGASPSRLRPCIHFEYNCTQIEYNRKRGDLLTGQPAEELGGDDILRGGIADLLEGLDGEAVLAVLLICDRQIDSGGDEIRIQLKGLGKLPGCELQHPLTHIA